jgi:hypothetical protein
MLACALLSCFSDARLVSFDSTGLTRSGVFSVTFANADAGREQFFLISEDDLRRFPSPAPCCCWRPACSASEVQRGGGP